MANQKYLISPLMDFILLGGASLFIFPAIMLAFPDKSGTITAAHYKATYIWLLFMVINIFSFSHFAYSYQLMYDRFFQKIMGRIDAPLQYRYIFAGIIVPIAMVLLFAYCFRKNDVIPLQYAVNFMFLTAGWHYAKQGFGILVVSSVYQKVFYDPLEKGLLLANSHLLWIYAWVMYNAGSEWKSYGGFRFQTLGLDPVIEKIFFVIVVASTLAVGYLLLEKYRREKHWPPFTGLTAYVATAYLWVILRFGHGVDRPMHPVVWLIPLMHAMQYIAVVLLMKRNEATKTAISWKQFWAFTALGILLGWVCVDTIPRFLDRSIKFDYSMYGRQTFMLLFWVFINIHHYFIDNVIWRKESSEAKDYLFHV